jgi:hypothetical protein
LKNLIRKFSFALLILFFSAISNAQNIPDTIDARGIQVSLLTCGVGKEIYSVFGHTAVRIVDSNKGTDIVYNYGTFDGYDKDFTIKFMRGKLLYYLSEEQYADFISLYQLDGRWVEEQVLNTTETEKLQIQSYLLNNLLPENRAYKYDFFFDNCATRIRDIFTQTHGKAFKYPIVLPQKDALTLGSKIDKNMTNAEIMFLPDYLRDGVAGATLNGKLFAQPSQKIVNAKISSPKANYVFWLTLYGVLVILLIGLFSPKLYWLRTIMVNGVLIVSGLLGVLILIMWFATDHQTCANNYNILWALPTNILFVFRKKQYKYALVAIVLLFVSFLLHLLQIQCLLLPEMIPVFLMLLAVFGSIYKSAKRI